MAWPCTTGSTPSPVARVAAAPLNGSVLVTWSATSIFVDHFEVSVTSTDAADDDPQPEAVVVVDFPRMTATVTGLPNHVPVTVSVTAITCGGEWSAKLGMKIDALGFDMSFLLFWRFHAEIVAQREALPYRALPRSHRSLNALGQ
jgi:hypothetical protein